MSLDVATAVNEAIDRVTTTAAAVLAVLFAVTGLLQSLATADLLVWLLESLYEYLQETDPEAAAEIEPDFQEAMAQQPAGLGLDVVPALALWIVGFVAGLVVLALAIDAFARAVDDPGELGPAHFGWKVLNLVVGAIVYGILVVVGTAMLVLPGLVVAVLLLYFPVAIVVDEDWFGAAFVSSVHVVGDALLATLGVVLLIVVAYVVGSIVSLPLVALLPAAAATAVQQAVGAVVWVFVVALLTRAYVGATDASPTENDDIVDDDWDVEV